VSTTTTAAPASAAEVAERLAACAAEGRTVRVTGGGTRAGWGRPVRADAELSTARLDAIAEHSPGDFTAVVGAGVPFERAQAAFAEAGQMLALDPPAAPGATIGGLVATADSGPRRHRYGTPRELVIGVQVALPDGTLARAGGKVIKNVAGYDLSKLMAGAFGTLGIITEVALRLHPRPERTATARFAAQEPEALGRIAAELAHRPLELEALDVRYHGGEGAILARFAGATAREQASELGGGADVLEDDGELWDAQRAGQRSTDGVVVRVSALPAELADVLRAADATGAGVAGRAGTGLLYLTLPAGDGAAETVAWLRSELTPAPCVVLDAPEAVRAALDDPWDVPEGPELSLARRVKERFDPAGTLNPGLFIGGM